MKVIDNAVRCGDGLSIMVFNDKIVVRDDYGQLGPGPENVEKVEIPVSLKDLVRLRHILDVTILGGREKWRRDRLISLRDDLREELLRLGRYPKGVKWEDRKDYHEGREVPFRCIGYSRKILQHSALEGVITEIEGDLR